MVAYRDKHIVSALGQDGFSATLHEAVDNSEKNSPMRRPWREGSLESTNSALSTKAELEQMRPLQSMGGVIEFSVASDGTLTALRLIDRRTDDLDIQAVAGTAPVVSIAPRAFEGSILRRVVLPAHLRQIGEMAFSGCTELERITVPGSVTRVGTLAFAKCSGLRRITIEPGVQALGPSSFSKCLALERVDIPVSVTVIGGGAFFGCGKQLVLCGASGGYVEHYAALNGIDFDAERWRMDESFTFAEDEDGSLIVTGMKRTALEQIDIPSELCGRQVVRIAPRAFFACGSLRRVSIGAGVKEIGESAFFGCRSLLDVRFERGLERIDDSAFAGCEALTQITLPWGLGQIGRMAFFGCTRLSFAKLPATTRVEDFAFDGCAQGLRVFGGVHVGRMQQGMREYAQNA